MTIQKNRNQNVLAMQNLRPAQDAGQSSTAASSRPVVAESASSVLPAHIPASIHGPRSPGKAAAIKESDARDRVSEMPDIFTVLSEMAPDEVPMPPEVKAAHEEALAREDEPVPPLSAPRPFHDELITLSRKIIGEENRVFDPVLVEEYRSLQKIMIDTGDMTHMPRAKAVMLEMHGLTQAQVDAGFRAGGATYSYRNTLGSLLALAPLGIVFEATTPQSMDDPARRAGLNVAYLAAALTVAVGGVAINTRALLQATVIQDGEFNGAPNIAKELAETPGYKQITEELAALQARIKGNTALDAARTAFLADAGNAELRQALETELDKADRADADDPAIAHYLTRAQLHHAYIGGLALQAALQTGKVIGNIAAGWAGLLSHPRVNAYVQIAVSIVQILAQRAVAPADQVRLQNLMWEMLIMLRKLPGDEQADREILLSMVRTPLAVRATNLESLTQSYVQKAEQKMANALQKANPSLDLNMVQRYRHLRQRREDLASYARHAQEMVRIGERCAAGADPELLGLAAQIHDASPETQAELIDAAAGIIGIEAADYRRHFALAQRQVSGAALAAEEQVELAELAATVAEKMDQASHADFFKIAGVPGLLQRLDFAEHTRDYASVEALCALIGEKTGVAAADLKEFYYLDTHRPEPLSPEENEELVALQADIHRANQNMSASGNADYIAADDRLHRIGRDPEHVKDRRFGDVSHVNAKLVRNGMQVTRERGFFESFTFKPESMMMFREGHRRAGNPAEYIATYASGIWRAFQLGITGANGPLLMNGTINVGIGIARATAADPASYQAPVWPYAISTAISLGAWGLNSYAAHHVAEAKVGPLSWADRVAKAEGGTSPIAETIIQIAKLDERTEMRKDPRFQEIGVDLMMTRYLAPTLARGTKGLAVLFNSGRQAKAARVEFDETVAVQTRGRQERDQTRAQLRDARASQTVADVAVENAENTENADVAGVAESSIPNDA